MSTRLWIISLLAFYMVNTSAREEVCPLSLDTLCIQATSDTDSVALHYERRLETYNRFFSSLVPSTVRLQYAGSTGFLNAGCGWEYGKRKQWETDVMFGYVPKYEKDSKMFTFTLRQSYVPWTKPLYGDKIAFQPFACGMFANSVLDSDYWVKEPERYPNRSYYHFTSKIRFHVFVGQRYIYNIPREKRFLAKSVSCVWELSTCDLYVISKATNKTWPWYELLSLSLGLKFVL